ncbi:unnamed protein product [Penicillium pancosmium]
MVLRIRLARFGNKHQPFYNIVVAQARCVRSHFPPISNCDLPLLRQHRQPELRANPRSKWVGWISARGSKPLEVIGTYNPLPAARTDASDAVSAPRAYKDITLDKVRAKYWLGVGAQASDPVWKLLNLARLVEEKPKTYNKA